MVIVCDREITIDLTVRLDRCLTIMFKYSSWVVKTRVTTDHITLTGAPSRSLAHTHLQSLSSDRPPVAVVMSLTFLVRRPPDCLCVCVRVRAAITPLCSYLTGPEDYHDTTIFSVTPRFAAWHRGVHYSMPATSSPRENEYLLCWHN